MVGGGLGRMTGRGICLWQAKETKPAHYWPKRTETRRQGEIKAENILQHKERGDGARGWLMREYFGVFMR